jgi:hypothetical protein
MKVISFLGVNNYSKTRYVWNDQEKETEFFPEAVAHFVQPEKILICLTPTAREGEKSKNWQELKRRFEQNGIPFEPLPIPEGHKEHELWEIFDALTNAVEENEQVLFDITNSFRSLPFLSFLAIAYLKSAKKVNVKNVLYGAWDARDADNHSPVFDLTSFVSLLDWLTASEQFIQTGNAGRLAVQLKKSNAASLDPLAQTVSEIALGLELLRPADVSASAQNLTDALGSAEAQLPQPFGVISQRLKEAYAQFGQTDDREGAKIHLSNQLRMINWYYQKQHFVHALALGREWVVSLLCDEFGLDLWEPASRVEAELLLQGGVRRDAQGVIVQTSPYLAAWKEHPQAKRINRLWGGEPFNLANFCNDVMHTGFRKSPKPAQEIVNQTKVIVEEINQIAVLWNLA